MMQFKCNCCGKVEDIPQWGAADGASVSNDGSPPDGYRTIYTVIEEHDGQGGTTTSSGEVQHSCADCNAHMSVEEHHEAEFDSRRLAMFQPPAARGAPVPLPDSAIHAAHNCGGRGVLGPDGCLCPDDCAYPSCHERDDMEELTPPP